MSATAIHHFLQQGASAIICWPGVKHSWEHTSEYAGKAPWRDATLSGERFRPRRLRRKSWTLWRRNEIPKGCAK